MDLEERRGIQRHRVLKAAKIVLNNQRSTIDCVVKSESQEGAKLKIAAAIGIPDQFELSIMGATPKPCRVVWRRADELGIAFI